MSAADQDLAVSTEPEERPLGLPHLLAFLAAAAVVGVVGAFVPGSMLALIAAAVAALAPRRHGLNVRIPLALIAGLIVYGLVRLYPAAEAAVGEATEGIESVPVLGLLQGVSFAGAIAVLFMPRQSKGAIQWLTLGSMFAMAVLSLMLLRVDMGRGYHFNEDVAWMPKLGIRYHVAVDGITLWLVVLTTLVTPIAAYASFGSIKPRMKDWCFTLLLLEGAMIGAFVALDLFLFYVYWELMLIPMYVMIGVWGGPDRIYAAVKFFLYTMFGSLLMLAAILYLGYTYGALNGGQWSFDYFELQRLVLPRNTQIWLWAAFTLAFVIKVPMFPWHTWLPDAHTQAPTGGSVILAAILLKLGTFAYIRFSMGLFPEACAETAANLAGVAVLGGIIYAALCAWKQDDLKRLVAYSSVAHLGYVMLGIFAATPASTEGAILQMVNHGISTGMLFLLVGVLYDQRHTHEIAAFGGIAKVMPVYTAFFLIATMASVGLPGTNGFIGEFMVITGTFASNRLGHFNGVQAAGAAFGVILGALYMLTAVQKVFFGPITHRENKRLVDVNPREVIALVPLTILIFVLGLFPNLLLSQMHGATARVLNDMQSRVEMNPGPDYYKGQPKLLARRPEATAVPAAVSDATAH